MSIFKDVNYNHPHYDAIKYVSDLDCMIETPSGLFEPDDSVRYFELLIYLARFFALDQTESQSRVSCDLEGFDWADQAFKACIAYGLCTKEDISSKKLDQEVNPMLLYETLQKAKKYFSCIGNIPNIRMHYGVITRGQLAECLYELGQNTAPIVLEQIEMLTNRHEYSKCVEFEESYKFCRSFYPSDLAKIFFYMEETSNPDAYKFMRKIMALKDPFTCKKEETKIIYHYTSLNALEKLTKPDARFRLSNTVYLNDPEEGKIASEIAKKIVSDYEMLSEWMFYKKESDSIQISNTFVASFMTQCDELTMWAQYGDGGSGCCIGFPTTCFKEELYSVFYEKAIFIGFFRKLCKILSEYVIGNPDIDIEQNPVFSYATMVVQQVVFLYKDPAYSYEKEVRILQFKHPRYAQAEDFIRPAEAFPRVYQEATFVRTDWFEKIKNLLPCDSILLGPKVNYPEKIAVALAHRGYYERIIKKSKIKFR